MLVMCMMYGGNKEYLGDVIYSYVLINEVLV